MGATKLHVIKAGMQTGRSPSLSSRKEREMEEKDFLRRDVCDLIEESAIQCTRNVSQSLFQAATNPKAHSCVQGVVERRFYPVHIRDFYSVINLLLLQMLLLRRRLAGEVRVDENDKTAGACECKSMHKKVQLLEQEVKESKKRYKEVSSVNT